MFYANSLSHSFNNKLTQNIYGTCNHKYLKAAYSFNSEYKSKAFLSGWYIHFFLNCFHLHLVVCLFLFNHSQHTKK